MSETALKLLEQIRALSDDEQLLIADELSVSDDEIDELDRDPEFQAMLAERLREVEDHPERLPTWDDARVQIDAELARRRAARGVA